PYSPELNPDEQVWREVKAHGTGRKAVSGKQELKRQLLSALKKLQRMPEKIRAFFRGPETTDAEKALSLLAYRIVLWKTLNPNTAQR
ncbi:MAG: hypothetical protein ACPL7M_00090, partial [Bryobacteraceae bacterium]